MKVKLKKTIPEAIIPKIATNGSAGFDLYACINDDANDNTVKLYPNDNKEIGTGLAMEIPTGYVGLIFSRSSWATKKDLSLTNAVGVIDSDYRGEIIVPLRNNNCMGRSQIGSTREVHHGDRIAQMIIIKHESPVFEMADKLENTARGTGGFGSTGEK